MDLRRSLCSLFAATYGTSQIQACPSPPGLSTIFENMRQIPGGGDKNHVKMPRSGAKKSVENPPATPGTAGLFS